MNVISRNLLAICVSTNIPKFSNAVRVGSDSLRNVPVPHQTLKHVLERPRTWLFVVPPHEDVPNHIFQYLTRPRERHLRVFVRQIHDPSESISNLSEVVRHSI